jgi:hypothetical protein
VAGFFFDTSAIVKRYIREMGSNWVLGLTDPIAGNVVHVSRITLVEFTSAITRRARGGSLTAQAAALAIGKSKHDFAHRFTVVGIVDALLDSAVAIAETHGLRAYDAVQLATALKLQAVRSQSAMPPLTLVSADAELSAAARAEGLAIEDPNAHP